VLHSRGSLVYGKFWVPGVWLGPGREKACIPAHRVAYYLVHGHWPTPQGLHGCDNTLCCNADNPAHVHEGTAKQNTAEMFERGRGVLPPVRSGEHASRAKLTDAQAREILERYGSGCAGISQAALATEYGVSQNSVSYIVCGKRRSLQ
jgi:hypothetical protein